MRRTQTGNVEIHAGHIEHHPALSVGWALCLPLTLGKLPLPAKDSSPVCARR